MNIAVAGSHGLIGNNLVTFFRKSNNNVSRIVRSKEQNGIFWDPYTGYINHEKLENYDVIINLCGEKIASLNPFFKNRDNIIHSRVNTNLLLSGDINEVIQRFELDPVWLFFILLKPNTKSKISIKIATKR